MERGYEMILIPGILISVMTFPGVIVHEAAHMFFCKLRKVPIFDVKFFQLDAKVGGYVLHGKPENFTSTFLISIGPLIINTLLCLIICLPAAIPIYLFDDSNIVSIFLTWLGVSIGAHAFPSHQDAENIWDEAKKEAMKGNVLAIISFPLVILIHIANLLRFFWFDVLYGVFIGIILSKMLFQGIF